MRECLIAFPLFIGKHYHKIKGMAHFNEKKETGTTNLAGGKAYKESKELQLVSLLLTSFGDDKTYRKAEDIFAHLDALIKECDKHFCAKAILFARNKFGMRTITHYATSVLAKYISGETWAKHFFYRVIYRPDDMTEIIACHLSRKQKLSNAMKKGFADAFGKFDEYQLAKYRSEGSAVKLVDVVNLVHPIQTENNNGAIEKLVKGELKSFDTWEVELSAVGNNTEAKKAVWHKLISENKLGYFALLRNLRNIINLGDAELKNLALGAIVNSNAIHKSLVLPFRYATAYNEISSIDAKAMSAISRACEIACDNVPKFDGKTLVALDVSGSMTSVADIAALFSAVLIKSNDCDIITFSERAQYKFINPDDSLMTIQRGLRFAGGGTNFTDIFNVANKKYDRVILLSDMQAWMPQKDWWGREVSVSPSAAYNAYKRKYNPDCKMYSLDLAGYGTLQVPEKDVYCLAGFSEKIFDLMRYLEKDKDALLNAIKEYRM